MPAKNKHPMISESQLAVKLT